jgi:hypothetical protein
LTLICTFTVVKLLGVFHDIVLAEHGDAANLAVILAYREAKAGIVKHRAVGAIVKRMFEAEVAAAAVYGEKREEN